MASQLFADLYGCDEKILNSEEDICKIARQVVSDIGAEIVEECVHTFEPIGITYFAVITTSHFSIHTWPEYGYAAVDVFSCGESVTEKITQMLKEYFGASEVKVGSCERVIGRTPVLSEE
ncbi:MAG: adenosylmethionine decarboxylase [Eubacterium sp.]|nr:adenosylmethionine decarboxylase [Eubacterium sp.]